MEDSWSVPDAGEVRSTREQRRRQREFHAFREELTQGRLSRFAPTDDLAEDLTFEDQAHRDLPRALRQFEEAPDEDVAGTVEPFNLQQEREAHVVDAAGNLHQRRQQGEKDSWVDALDDLPVKKVKVTEDTEDAPQPEPQSAPRLKSRLHGLMRDGETVAQALNRLKGANKTTPGFKRNRRKNETQGSAAATDPSPEFNAAVEVVSALVASGELDVYEWSKSDLEPLYKVKTGENVSGPFTLAQLRRFESSGGSLQILRVSKLGRPLPGEAWADLSTLHPEDFP